MSIPDFQLTMLPLLRHLADGKERTNQETLDVLAQHFSLTEAEQAQLLPSGLQGLFMNRVAWAKSHLKGARCIESVGRGVYRITDRGRELLRQNPSQVNLRTLREFPEYLEFRKPKSADPPIIDQPDVPNEMTPEEHLEYGYKTIRDQISSDLLQRIKAGTPSFFEGLVVELLLAMGYGGSRSDAGKTVGRSGDGGIDGVIKEDRLGLDVIYIQAKRWEGTVGRPEIQKFAGALQGQRAKKGVFITTSDFSKDAHSFASQLESKIVLIDGALLAGLMIDFGIGVTTTATYSVCRVDSDYFDQA
jgi:restriction system protein